MIAEAKRDTGTIEVDLWFDKDRWRLLRARLYGGKTGHEVEYTLEMVKSSFGDKNGPSTFMLEQSKVTGYEKKTLAEIKEAVGGGSPRL